MREDTRERLLEELMGPNPRGVLHRLSSNAMDALLARRSYDPLGLQDSDLSSEGSDEHSYFDSASLNGSGAMMAYDNPYVPSEHDIRNDVART